MKNKERYNLEYSERQGLFHYSNKNDIPSKGYPVVHKNVPKEKCIVFYVLMINIYPSLDSKDKPFPLFETVKKEFTNFLLTKPMPLKTNDYQQPDFLLCEIPVKDESFNDDRLWVYSRLSLSLIEFICLNDIDVSHFQNTQKEFTFFDEQWIGIFVQNNCETTDQNETEILNQAWKFFRDYLAWEDVQILED